MPKSRCKVSRIVVVAAAIQGVLMALVRPLLHAKPISRPDSNSDAELLLGRKTEEQVDQGVEECFLQYEEGTSSSDVSGISALYADIFMFGGPNGVQAVNKEDFLKVVPKMKAYFSSMGLTETQLGSVEATSLDSKYLFAKVEWKMRLQNSSGSRTLETFATYILVRGNGDALSIAFQIDHQDLASMIKEPREVQQTGALRQSDPQIAEGLADRQTP
jgi:ketosteroid isomerase-like protein